MTASVVRQGFARRFAAIALLALLAWMIVPLLAAPFERWSAQGEAIETSRALQERAARSRARAAAVASLASRADAPFLTAADEEAAFLALRTRIEGAAPSGAMQIEELQTLPRDERPNAPIAASFGFTATQGAFHAFLAEIETRPPFLAVDELEVASSVEAGDRILLSGTATLSAVPLVRNKP